MDNQMTRFSITSVCRADLEREGFDVTNVTDDTMSELASKMEDAYVEQNFWTDLKIIASDLDIPTKESAA